MEAMDMTVYVPHIILRREADGRVTEVDLSAAEKYGELLYLLNQNAMTEPESGARMLRSKLRCYTSKDYILLGGDIAAAAAATAIAASYNGGVVNTLRWDPLYREYRVVPINCR